jgi:imidazolonepropionase-like amidohydrolase
MLALSLLLALPPVASGEPAASPPPASRALQSGILAIRVDGMISPTGALIGGGWLIVRNGRLEAVGAGAPPADAQVLEFPGGIACPGLIDPVTSLGASGELEEPARAFTPDVLAGDGFRADHSSFAKAARGGITTAGLSPSSSNVVGGRLAVIRCAGEHGLAVLVGPGPMRCALTPSAFNEDRAPTSRMGALPQLRELLKSDALNIPGPCVVEANSPDEIRIALETFGAATRPVALLQPILADDALDSIKGVNALAILGPYELGTPTRQLRLAQVIEGVNGPDGTRLPVAFTGDGDASALRLTAALAVRAGFPRDKALQAMTTVPARILGVEADSATLEAGKRADVVVFHGDPLDLASKIELVLVGGAPQDLKKGTP